LLGPETANSPNADDLNTLYWVMLIIGTVLALAINAALIALVLRFRAKRGVQPRRVHTRRPAQLLIGGVFAGLAVVLFVIAVIVTDSAREVSKTGDQGLQASQQRLVQRDLKLPALGDDDAEPLRIEADGQQWIWRYQYPGSEGAEGVFSYYDLVIPVDTTVILDLGSTDVVHRWYVPGLGGKFDAVPGRSNQTWFQAEEEGDYEGQSYQYSGASYSVMRTRVRVVSVEEYQGWLEQQQTDIEAAQAFVQEQIVADTELDDPSGVPAQPSEEVGGSAQETGSDDAPGGGGAGSGG
jgi:cytochrome c oxidase subunit II